jgi:outer membrane protein
MFEATRAASASLASGSAMTSGVYTGSFRTSGVSSTQIGARMMSIERGGHARQTPAIVRAAAALCVSCLLARPAAAQAGRESPGSERPPDWTVSIGGAVLVVPRYEGSSSVTSIALPYLNVTFRDRAFLSFPGEGLGVYLVKAGPLRIGTALNLSWGRFERYPSYEDSGLKQKPDPVLKGWGHVDPAPELRAYLLLRAGPVGLEASARHAVGGGDGTLVVFAASAQFPEGPRFLIPFEISLTWADASYNQTFFGVTATQSALAAENGVSIAPYAVGAGLKSASLGSGLVWIVSRHWSVSAHVSASPLLDGDIRSSPVVQQSVMVSVMVLAAHTF